MSEHSYFHNGATTGDAVEAPYSSALFSKIFSTIHSSKESGVIFTDTLDMTVSNLVPAHSAAGGINHVVVYPGSAIVGGVLYVNSAPITFTVVANTSSYPRIDAVVVRANWALHTARLVYKSGRPGTAPTYPELLQEIGDVYEMPVAYFYNDGTVNALYVWDARPFLNTALHANTYATRNMQPNSEFMTPAAIPDMWVNSGAVGDTIATDTKFDYMDRGQTRKIGNYSGTEQLSISYATVNPAHNTTNLVFTFKIELEVLSGAVIISYNGASDLAQIPVTNGPIEFILRVGMGVTFPDVILMFEGIANTIFKLGQITATYGYIPATTKTTHEMILYKSARSTAYTKSTGTTQINADVLPGTRAAVINLYTSDTGSAGGNTFNASLQSNKGNADQLRVEIGRRTNSKYNNVEGIVGFDPATYTAVTNPDQLQLVCTASGAGTMSVTTHYVGIIV